MADIFDHPKVPIDVRTLEGMSKVNAWIDGHFAVHQQVLFGNLLSLSYVITHLPSGIGMGPLFAKKEDAAACVRDLVPLCDWLAFEPKMITGSFRAQVKAVMLRHGAVSEQSPNLQLLRDRAVKEFATDLNGYGAQAKEVPFE